MRHSEIHKLILSIAGFDPSGKAGILKDISIISELGAHGEAIPTALTIQDFSQGFGFEPVASLLFERMLSVLLADRKPDAVKIGMVPNVALAAIIRQRIAPLRLPVIYDPVLSTADGTPLTIPGEEIDIFQTIAPLASVVTPNIPEASLLAGISLEMESFEKIAAEALFDFGAGAVLIKGGHSASGEVADMLLLPDGEIHSHSRQRIAGNPRGTGCALSSALAKFLADGNTLPEAFTAAENAMDRLLQSGFLAR